MREKDFGEVLARELSVKKDPKVKHDDRALSVFLRIEDGQLGTTHPSTYLDVDSSLLEQSFVPNLKAATKSLYAVDWKKYYDKPYEVSAGREYPEGETTKKNTSMSKKYAGKIPVDKLEKEINQAFMKDTSIDHYTL